MKTVAIFVLVAAIATAVTTISTLAPAALADKNHECSGSGFERADCNVHENTGPVSKQDVRFHEGTCQGGHTTKALEGLGGCDALSKPGNSDDHRQDSK
jgi:hypothetical protein